MASGFSTKTGKKYGFVSAADIKIAAPRGANMHSASLRTPMNRVGVIKSPTPGMTRAGVAHWGEVDAMGVNQKVTSGIQKLQQRYATNPDEERAAASTDWSEYDPLAPPAAGFAPGRDSLDTNMPASPMERQQQADSGPIVLPPRLERFAASRVGRFAEGRLERSVDKRFGAGVYAAETGRGRRRGSPDFGLPS
jgi:hypothetical protein